MRGNGVHKLVELEANANYLVSAELSLSMRNQVKRRLYGWGMDAWKVSPDADEWKAVEEKRDQLSEEPFSA